MVNSLRIKTALVKAALITAIPPTIRESLINDHDFRELYKLQDLGIVTFGDAGIPFSRSMLLKAIRKVLLDNSVVEILDAQGQSWQLENLEEAIENPHLVLIHNSQKINLPDLDVIMSDAARRLACLEKEAVKINLPLVDREKWLSILKDRPLDDDEVGDYFQDLEDTPVNIANTIKGLIGHQPLSVSNLIPTSRRYYERLVGRYDGSISFLEYWNKNGAFLIDYWLNWNTEKGLRFCLLYSSHSSSSIVIQPNRIDKDVLLRVVDSVDKHGDSISQIGAIELGLKMLPSIPEIEFPIISLIDKLANQDIEKDVHGLRLLSALFILVDAELSRKRILSPYPPFYRRFAALTHAALIHRQLLRSSVDDGFCQWAIDNSSWNFTIQNLVDLRLEPRWNSNYAAETQLKAEFLGRILAASEINKLYIKSDSKLFEKIVEIKPGNSLPFNELLRLYLPGPLEGSEQSPLKLPELLSKDIQENLLSSYGDISSFFVLVNSALLFHIDADYAELATKALQMANHHLANISEISVLLNLLYGLSTVASITRSSSLANEIRILSRKYRRDKTIQLPLSHILAICLTSAAAFVELNEWGKFLGDWLSELAFGELTLEEGKTLLATIKYLCHIVPELWYFCGIAMAAVEAYVTASQS